MTTSSFLNFFIIILFFLQIRMITFIQSYEAQLSYSVIMFLIPILSFLVLLKLLKKWSAQVYLVFVGLFLFTFLSGFVVVGKVYHSHHIWIMASIILVFIKAQESLFVKRNLNLIRLIQVYALSTYFFAGLWKIRDLFTKSNVKWFDLGLEYYAISVVTETQPSHLVKYWISEPLLQSIISFGFFAVIAFQLSCVVPIFRHKNILFFGVMVVLFHLVNGLLLGHWFIEAILASLYFLIYLESKKHEA